MAKIKIEDIIGYFKNSTLFCVSCAQNEGFKKATLKELFLKEDVESEETLYFCDICKEKIV